MLLGKVHPNKSENPDRGLIHPEAAAQLTDSANLQKLVYLILPHK